MKVVITGGFGFLGRRLCDRILALGELVGPDEQLQKVSEILLFDQAEAPAELRRLDPRVRVRSGSVADAGTCADLVDRDGVVVFHLASVMSGQGELDFDLCVQVNLVGTQNLLEACRKRRLCRFVFCSSGACYGERPAGPETDATKLLPATTYGMTKACCELLVNDYSRRGFLDGRVARLPTVIPRPGKNSGLPAAFSAVIREPLNGEDVELPIRRDMPHAVCGFRVLVHNLLRMAQLPEVIFSTSSDRCMNMPSLKVTLEELENAVLQTVRDPSRLGKVTYQPDEALCAKLATFHRSMDATRARSLGMLGDSSPAAIVSDFAAEYVSKDIVLPVLELPQEARHNLVVSNDHVRVFRTEFPPGDATLRHAHRVDSLYFFLAGARVRNQRQDCEAIEDTLEAGEVRYGDHCSCPLVHEITNIGRTPMFCLDVELHGFARTLAQESPGKRPRSQSDAVEVPDGLKLVKERRGARVYDLEVPQGGSWKGLLEFATMLWIVRWGADVRGSLGARRFLPGDAVFRQGPAEFDLRVADGPLRMWLVHLL